jgi:hypothetical protein
VVLVLAEDELLLVESRGGRSSDINSMQSRNRKNRTPNAFTPSLSVILMAVLKSLAAN